MARLRHAVARAGADLAEVTTLGYAHAHPWARRPTAPAAPAGPRRLVGTLHEPNAWTVGIVLATGVVLIARHPIARLLGTETELRPAVVGSTPVPAHVSAPTQTLSLPVVAVPTHAPRDPFRALVTAGGKLLAPVSLATSVPGPPSNVVQAVTPSATGSCSGAAHRVVAGDTLWTLAARAVRSSDTDRVTLAWHRLYAANRSVIGSDPAVLQPGEKLCVPSGL